MSWNTHSIISRIATLNSIDDKEKLTVTPIDTLIKVSGEALSQAAHRFRSQLYRELGLPLNLGNDCQQIITPLDFLRCFRLNPITKFRYVRVMEVEETLPDMIHDPSRDGPPGHSYIDTQLETHISPDAVFLTYSDEPDWGMDQELFSIPAYSMGSPPFGPATGSSSQAPFHMAFFHEKRITYWIMPSLGKRLLIIRSRMCFNLAEIAFNCNQSYWGWRFLGWAAHYLQDVTCPYHCCPFPPKKEKMLKRFLMNPFPKQFVKNNMNFLRNRHALFETTVSYVMNEHFKKQLAHPFIEALKANSKELPADIDLAAREISKLPYLLAPKINNLMVQLFSWPLIDKADYYLGDDPDFAVNGILEQAIEARASYYGEFVELVSQCLHEAGRITRFVIESSRGFI